MPSPKLPPHVFRVKNKIGRFYTYHQRGRGTDSPGPRTRLPCIEADKQLFWAEYSVLEQLPQPRLSNNRIELLAEQWQASPEWAAMSPKSQRLWGDQLKRICASWGELDVAGIEPRNVLVLRDQYSHQPATANNLLRCLRSMLAWSVPRGWRTDNPCREIRQLKAGDGYEPWPWDVVEAARIDLRPDLWYVTALALYTGQRLSDVLSMTWAQIDGPRVALKQSKTGKALKVPVHRDLRPVLASIPRTSAHILTTPTGQPWIDDKGRVGRFQSAWARCRPKAVIDRGLVFHGLRKTAVVTLLEAGCTDGEVASITGQSRSMVEHYAKGVNQELMARTAMDRWEGMQ